MDIRKDETNTNSRIPQQTMLHILTQKPRARIRQQSRLRRRNCRCHPRRRIRHHTSSLRSLRRRRRKRRRRRRRKRRGETEIDMRLRQIVLRPHNHVSSVRAGRSSSSTLDARPRSVALRCFAWIECGRVSTRNSSDSTRARALLLHVRRRRTSFSSSLM